MDKLKFIIKLIHNRLYDEQSPKELRGLVNE